MDCVHGIGLLLCFKMIALKRRLLLVVEAVPDIFNLLPINEAPKSHVEEDAEFQELVYSHLPLPVENVPERFLPTPMRRASSATVIPRIHLAFSIRSTIDPSSICMPVDKPMTVSQIRMHKDRAI